MDEQLWGAVDGYLAGLLVEADPVLDTVLDANRAAGLPSIDVSPVEGKLLHLLARVSGAQRILEIGTLGGYSTIWLARALPAGGRLVTLEREPRHAAVATDNIARAGLTERVDVVVGPALETLPSPADHDPAVVGSRRLVEALAAEPRLSATALQTVGAKGHDGFALAVVSS